MSQDSKLKKAKIEALIIIFTPQRQRKIGPKKILLIFLKKHEPQNDLFIFFLKSVFLKISLLHFSNFLFESRG